jgi:hypothetical protein
MPAGGRTGGRLRRWAAGGATASTWSHRVADTGGHAASGCRRARPALTQLLRTVSVCARFPACYGQGGTACIGVPQPAAVLDAHAAVGGMRSQPGSSARQSARRPSSPSGRGRRCNGSPSIGPAPKYKGSVRPFLTGIQNPLAIVLAPDRSLLVGDWAARTIYRIGPRTVLGAITKVAASVLRRRAPCPWPLLTRRRAPGTSPFLCPRQPREVAGPIPAGSSDSCPSRHNPRLIRRVRGAASAGRSGRTRHRPSRRRRARPDSARTPRGREAPPSGR